MSISPLNNVVIILDTFSTNTATDADSLPLNVLLLSENAQLTVTKSENCPGPIF